MKLIASLGISAALLAGGNLLSQTYAIDGFKVAGGGGTSTNGQYSLSGPIGQHDAGGPMTNGPYSLTGGFWVWPTLVQTPGAPTLPVTHADHWLRMQSHGGFLYDPAGWAPPDANG